MKERETCLTPESFRRALDRLTAKPAWETCDGCHLKLMQLYYLPSASGVMVGLCGNCLPWSKPGPKKNLPSKDRMAHEPPGSKDL